MPTMAIMIAVEMQPERLVTSSCASSSVGRELPVRRVRLDDPPIALFSE